MNQDEIEKGSQAATDDVDIGTYDVIVARLEAQAQELATKAEDLNTRRTNAFGTSEFIVIGNERVRTANNCVPRDIVQVGNHLLFGYNVFLGLKTETGVADVLSLHRFAKNDSGFDVGEVLPESDAAAFLQEPNFVREFVELYRFYKSAKLIRLSRTETKLLAVFQIGETHKDVRVFRWALSAQNFPTYIDNRGERDHAFPPQHDFEWTECTRDNHVEGTHPHMSILDKVFVETSGGDLTIKVENNTERGEGIYREPVDDSRQTINDANFSFAELGTLILLAVRPYNEKNTRYLVFSTRTHKVERIDAIGRACVQLPEDHGIVFPGGYFLQDGRSKIFDGSFNSFEFERSVRSPNGEDVLYVFHEHTGGEYVLLSYNSIRKEMANPIRCHGYSLFEDGRAIVFRNPGEEPTRVHQMQIWQTPFISAEFAAAAPPTAGYLGKVGNAELVRGISNALSLRRAVVESKPARQVYEDLIAAATRTIDAHYWLGHEEVGDLLSTVVEIRATAELVIGEFDKVEAIKQRATSELNQATEDQIALKRILRPDSWTEVNSFMNGLSELRKQRGKLIGLRDLRFMDLERVEVLEREVVEQFDHVSNETLRFLAKGDALAPLKTQLEDILAATDAAEKTPEVARLTEKLEKTADGVSVLSEVVASLKSDDPTERTAILERISEVYSQVNRVRATLVNRRKGLLSKEGKAEFGVQFQLFKQSVDSALTQAQTPEACDDQLSRLIVQLEELEARFSEFDEFLGDLADKRDEVYEVFSTKKQQLLDERQRRANNLMTAAERILASVARRSEQFGDQEGLNGFFASDPMVQKLRDLCTSLRSVGDSSRAEEVESRLKTARQSSLRGLRDRLELFDGGKDVVKFGRHRFAVNTQPLELTMVPHGQTMALSLTGTDFREPVDDSEFEATRPYWNQHLVSESSQVYRGEFLAASILFAAEKSEAGLSLQRLLDAEREEGGLAKLVRDIAAQRYDEGYERGLHDADATRILQKVLSLRQSAGLLRFNALARTTATLFWALSEHPNRANWQRRAQSLGRLSALFAASSDLRELASELERAIREYAESALPAEMQGDSHLSALYLTEELRAEHPRMITRAAADALLRSFQSDLELRGARSQFHEDLKHLADTPKARAHIAYSWIRAYHLRPGGGTRPLGVPIPKKDDEQTVDVEESNEDTSSGANSHQAVIAEAAGILLSEGKLDRQLSSGFVSAKVEQLLGQHPRISDQTLEIELDEFLSRLTSFIQIDTRGYQRYRKLRADLIDVGRKRLRLDEFKPKTLSSFVRNRLINDAYLPLIGDNFAKQLGAAGDSKRTDLMGLLLLISPPGYGKTTLMEYVAGRLGLAFMKVNGPALGHAVTSLDPTDAPNAPARQEVDKINLALEMGNNVMLYLDDIQHTNPELLQKFISVCDAQRRIEGVWNGRTKTYDLRGKRFCVVMAGNPYTEAGERFQIPDMLSNRADTYNLGDVLSGKEEAFSLSYIENSITSNSVLAPLANREQADIYKLVDLARGRDVAASDLSHSYSSTEIEELKATLRHLFKAQELLLKVNSTYIASASQDDRYRTEPPFKLQGSYRNMNKLAEKIVPALNEQELDRLLRDHYQGEAQTLTTGAEQNLLKLAELMGNMTPEQRARWDAIKAGYVKSKNLGGAEEDPVTRVTRQLSLVSEQLQGIAGALSQTSDARTIGEQLTRLTDAVLEIGPTRAPSPRKRSDDTAK